MLLLEQRLFDNYANVMVYVSSMKIFRTSLFLNEDKNLIFSIWKTSGYIFFETDAAGKFVRYDSVSLNSFTATL